MSNMVVKLTSGIFLFVGGDLWVSLGGNGYSTSRVVVEAGVKRAEEGK